MALAMSIPESVRCTHSASPVAGAEEATVFRVARNRDDLVAAARLRFLAQHGGHPAGAGRVVHSEFDEQESMALHVLAVDGDEPVGTVRVLRSDGRPLPVESLFGVDVPAGVHAAELSRPALQRPNDQRLLVGLLRAAYDEIVALGVDRLYLVADQRLLTLLRALGFRFRAVGGPVWAYGSWNIAAALTLDEMVPGLRVHQAVHGCRIADFFTTPFDGAVPAQPVCLRDVS